MSLLAAVLTASVWGLSVADFDAQVRPTLKPHTDEQKWLLEELGTKLTGLEPDSIFFLPEGHPMRSKDAEDDAVELTKANGDVKLVAFIQGGETVDDAMRGRVAVVFYLQKQVPRSVFIKALARATGLPPSYLGLGGDQLRRSCAERRAETALSKTTNKGREAVHEKESAIETAVMTGRLDELSAFWGKPRREAFKAFAKFIKDPPKVPVYPKTLRIHLMLEIAKAINPLVRYPAGRARKVVQAHLKHLRSSGPGVEPDLDDLDRSLE